MLNFWVVAGCFGLFFVISLAPVCFCKFFWIVVDYCWLCWIIVKFLGSLLVDVGCCGVYLDVCRLLWTFFGLLWVTMDTFEFFWVRCGSFLVLVNPHVLSIWMYQICLICTWCMYMMYVICTWNSDCTKCNFYVLYFLEFSLRPTWWSSKIF